MPSSLSRSAIRSLSRRLAGWALLAVTATVGLNACAGGGDAPTEPRSTPKDPVLKGSLLVSVTGMPAGSAADVTVSGPAGFSRSITATAALADLTAGRYTVTARSVRTPNGLLEATPTEGSVEIVGGTPPSTISVAYAPAQATVGVLVEGLPGGAAAAVTLGSPTGNSSAVTASTRVRGPAGRWTVAAGDVKASGFTYTATPVSAEGTVAPGDSLGFRVQHTLATGAVAVVVSGLPAGSSATYTISLAGGTASREGNLTGTGTATITDLAPGTYTLTAPAVNAAEGAYRPTVASQQFVISPSLVAVPVSVNYSAVTSTLIVTVAGAPSGATDMVRVTGPSGFTRLLSATTALAGLVPGSYTVVASDIVQAAATWHGAPVSAQLSLAGDSTVTVPITYAVSSGSIAVSIGGLPGGTAGAVTVTGPNGFSRILTNSSTLANLVPGSYMVAAGTVAVGDESYGGTPLTQTLNVAASLVATPAVINYWVRAAALTLRISGAPGGAQDFVHITGPNNFDRTISATTTFEGLVPGSYAVASSDIVQPSAVWRPTPATVTRALTLDSRDTVAVSYGVTTGMIAITMSGLPAGVNGNMQLTGPGGYLSPVSGTSTFVRLTPGTYTLTASSVSASGNSYTPAPASQQITVIASISASGATVTYINNTAPPATTGALAVTVSGLPAGVSASVTLTGTSTSRNVTGSATLTGLAAGTYTLSAANVTDGGTTYTGAPAGQSVAITANATSNAAVTYTVAPTPTGDDLSVEQAYVTQATQRLDGAVPLVAGRDALLRVFVKTSRANTLKPDVRVRIYESGTLIQTTTITAPEGSVRTATAEGTLASTWNTVIPGANVRPGMRILADVDPAVTVGTDADRSNNIWPRSSTPQAVTVNNVPALNIRFVPVTVGALTGNVSLANMGSFLASSRLVHPLNTVNADVRLPFTSSATVLQSGDANNAWLTVLSEMNTLRATDGAGPSMHYFGVVKVGYSSGVAGYGYVPGRAAVGWDYLPSGDGVATHELGHNFSRPHSPCGVSGDASYPYAGGLIGSFGWNSTSNSIVSTSATDFMGYCSNTWTSDWTWNAVMGYRASSSYVASASIAGNEAIDGDGLLVWGRIVNGKVLLEPAFRVKAPVSPRAVSAQFRVEALDASGGSLIDIPIDAPRVDHAFDHEERQFAVILPWTASLESSLASVRVRDVRSPLLAATRSSDAARRAGTRAAAGRIEGALSDPSARVERIGGRDRLRWNTAAYPMALVRDVATGQTIAFLRNAGDAYVARGRAVDVVLSDGVRSIKRRVPALGQPQ